MGNQLHEEDESSPDTDMDVEPIDPIPPASTPAPMQASIDVFEGITVPTNPTEHALLVQRFRDEVYQDWVDDQMSRYNLRGAVSAYELDIVELQEAMHVRGQDGGMPYATMANIRRHDWNRAADCIYTIEIAGGRYRGNAESLSQRLGGLRRALFDYWESRTRVSPRHILAYLEAHGAEDYFRAIMWHHLPLHEWLARWRARRLARRE
jgi:hypothetical protein